jgi:hypothetical protein
MASKLTEGDGQACTERHGASGFGQGQRQPSGCATLPQELATIRARNLGLWQSMEVVMQARRTPLAATGGTEGAGSK